MHCDGTGPSPGPGTELCRPLPVRGQRSSAFDLLSVYALVRPAESSTFSTMRSSGRCSTDEAVENEKTAKGICCGPARPTALVDPTGSATPAHALSNASYCSFLTYLSPVPVQFSGGLTRIRSQRVPSEFTLHCSVRQSRTIAGRNHERVRIVIRR